MSKTKFDLADDELNKHPVADVVLDEEEGALIINGNRFFFHDYTITCPAKFGSGEPDFDTAILTVSIPVKRPKGINLGLHSV